ncbi:DUF6318 family protein [Nocardioides mesophilus]|uniref:DUF6318 domain-containing protein n=1 Tax=Nocardioides mesophilus TaxID=433659 RepID=A0A7G9R9L0_9ACTN|nr:DUF6318 family protein [Nocardioides mesophilus]QNN52285.1 hypothetical protein H9L09_17635 [Nocardioides mesophilus]
MARVVVGPVLLGLAALSACTSSAEPAPLPSPSPSASSSAPAPSPSATPPSLPPAASGTSPAAAKAFARHYFDSINYAAATGDTDELRALGAEDCVSCEAIASNIEKVYQAGGHIESDGWTVTSIRSLKTTAAASVLSLGVYLEAEVAVDRRGKTTRHPGQRQPMTMFLVRQPSGYEVSRLDLVSS